MCVLAVHHALALPLNAPAIAQESAKVPADAQVPAVQVPQAPIVAADVPVAAAEPNLRSQAAPEDIVVPETKEPQQPVEQVRSEEVKQLF